MTARFRPLIFLCIAALLSACASSPSSTLGELPHTPQASTQQLLKDADASDPGKAALLRLSAADQSIQQDNLTQARQILEQVAIDQLMPAQQMFAKTLEAELARKWGLGVKLSQSDNGAGKLTLAFKSQSELDRVLAALR